MLCPEVLNFKAPESSFQINTIEVNAKHTLNKQVNSLDFNHLVSIVIPDTLRLPESLPQLLTTDNDYYKISNLKISELIKKDFISNFIKSGNLTLLSIDTRIDCDNCIAVTPKGRLILNLDKVTYQKLGIEGTVSHFHNINKDRYIINIDLTLEFTKSTKTKYEKLTSRLETLNTFNVVTLWEPINQEVCPSSIAKYFHDLGYTTKVCRINHNISTVYSKQAPLINFEDIEEDEINSFAEWLGMILLNADLPENLEDYVNSYETPSPNVYLGQIKILKYQGFFSCTKIFRMKEELQKFLIDQDKPWVAVYVQSFSDSPISWNGEEHHHYINGDNSYLVILNKIKHVFCKLSCSKKKYK